MQWADSLWATAICVLGSFPSSDCLSEGTSAWPVLPRVVTLERQFWWELLVRHSLWFPFPFCFFSHSFFLQGQFCNTLGKAPPAQAVSAHLLSFSGLTLLTPSLSVSEDQRPSSGAVLHCHNPQVLFFFLFNHLFQQLLNQPYLLLCDSGQVSGIAGSRMFAFKKRRKSSPIDTPPLYKEDVTEAQRWGQTC